MVRHTHISSFLAKPFLSFQPLDSWALHFWACRQFLVLEVDPCCTSLLLYREFSFPLRWSNRVQDRRIAVAGSWAIISSLWFQWVLGFYSKLYNSCKSPLPRGVWWERFLALYCIQLAGCRAVRTCVSRSLKQSGFHLHELGYCAIYHYWKMLSSLIVVTAFVLNRARLIFSSMQKMRHWRI